MRKADSLNSNLNLGHFSISRNSVVLKCLTIILLFFLIKVPLESTAQSVELKTFGTASFDFKVGLNSYTFSIGETLTHTLTADAIITQGFLQPRHTIPCTDFELIAYPNPTTGVLSLKFDGCDDKPERVVVIDIFGKILFDTPIPDNKIDMGELTTGIYFIKVVGSSNKELGLVKIAKVSR